MKDLKWKCDDCGGKKPHPDSIRTCANCNGKMRTEDERKTERIKAAYADVQHQLIQGIPPDIGSIYEAPRSLWEDMPKGVRVLGYTHDEILFEAKGDAHDELLEKFARFSIQKDVDLHRIPLPPPREIPFSEAIRKWDQGEARFPAGWPKVDYASLERKMLLHLPREDWPDWFKTMYEKEGSSMGIKPSDIIREIVIILQSTNGGMSAYQIADTMSKRFPNLFRNLESEYGMRGNGSMFRVIAKGCLKLAGHGRLSYMYMNSHQNVEFIVGGRRVTPSSPLAIYLLV